MTGSLVLYKGRPALVIDVGEKITITTGLEKKTETLKVREKDIEVLHPGPLKSLEELETAMQGDVEGAWELIESGGVPVTLRELAELAYNSFTPRSAWAAWLLLSEGLYFTGTAGALSARSASELKAAEEKCRSKMQDVLDREDFLDRMRKLLQHPTGTTHPAGAAHPNDTAAGIDPVRDGRFFQDIEALACEKTDKSRTMKELGRTETPQEAHRLLLECGYWDMWVNPHPRRCGISLASADVPAELIPPDTTGGLMRQDLTRQDLTHLPAFAIDSTWSTDPDDAVSLETIEGRRILYVHVADPACIIEHDSPIDKEARSRGATLYLPEGTFRMLPEEFLPRFALGLDTTSPALSFRITLDDNGAVEDTEIIPSVVRVTRLSYEAADAAVSALADSAASAEAGTILKELFALGEANFKRRLNAGAVHISLPEVHITVDDGADNDCRAVEIRPIVQYRSADMVRECMLLAGEGAAAWAARRQLPFPYITQETGDLPARPLPGLAGNYQLRRCMRPRTVSAKPGCHWGLGLDAYSQVTSPLRRYTDLLAHQQIRAALSREQGGGEKVLDEDQLFLALASGDAAAQNITKAERASRAHWTAVYLKTLLVKNAEAVWDAVVLEKRGNNLGVMIPGLALETQLGGSSGTPNETLQVRLKSVRIPEAEAVFVA